jgi:hypothetical protein
MYLHVVNKIINTIQLLNTLQKTNILPGTQQRSGFGTTLQAGRSRVRDPMRSINLLNLPNLFGRTRPWGSLSL